MTQTLYAHLDNANRVTEPPVLLPDAPVKFYGEVVGARFRPCPPETQQGSTYDPQAETWSHPPAPEPVEPIAPPAEPEPQYRTTMTPIRFKAQFSLSAQVAIKRARAYVDGTDTNATANAQKSYRRDVLDVLFGSLDDPRLQEVDVTDPSVIGGIDFCLAESLIVAEEAASIKRGVPV